MLKMRNIDDLIPVAEINISITLFYESPGVKETFFTHYLIIFIYCWTPVGLQKR